MCKEEKYREISNIEQDCKEGLLFSAWTNKWGLKVYAWYGMDLVTFSFIEKGKKGKGKSFDVSVPAKKNYYFDFLDFSHEVLQDIRTPYDFVEIMEQEKADAELYPKRYRFTAGPGGEKTVGFCNSSTGGKEYCINASMTKDNKMTVVNMPLSYYDIYEMADAFAKTYKEREQELMSLLEQGIKNRSERIKNAAELQVYNLTVTTTSDLQKSDHGDYFINAKTSEGSDIVIRITQDAIHKINAKREDCFALFQERVSKKETTFRFSGRIHKDTRQTEYIFEKFENGGN